MVNTNGRDDLLACLDAIERTHPPELAARLGHNARHLAEREFDRELLAERALSVLREAAGG